jgi:hypothetical protein
MQLPFVDAMPFIFGLNLQTRMGACFFYGNDKFEKVDLFDNVPLRQIQGVLRVRSGEKPYTIGASLLSTRNEPQ